MAEIIKGPSDRSDLPQVLEGYLYGLGEVCHSLFGPKGEEAMYNAIGAYFLKFLKEKYQLEFSSPDPWNRYVEIIRYFTKHGFYSYVELEEREGQKYYMLEKDQYAGSVWSEQKSWERGTPPCPLWAIILHSLQEISYTIILDDVNFSEEANGFESIFHFEKIEVVNQSSIEEAKKIIQREFLPICAHCKKVRNQNQEWVVFEEFFAGEIDVDFTHGICPECAESLLGKSKRMFELN